MLNGNRGQRGNGINCIYWNKVSSFLKNKCHEIKNLINVHKPHILGLGEANFKDGHRVEDVSIEGYNIHIDSAVHSSELGNLARVVVFTHELLRVHRRHDLECENVLESRKNLS